MLKYLLVSLIYLIIIITGGSTMKRTLKFYLKTLIYIFIMIICLSATVILIILTHYFSKYYSEGLNLSSVDVKSVPYIYDKDEKEIGIIYNKNLDNDIYTKINTLPSYVYNAFIAIEDKRFYKHQGFDLKRFTGATIEYITTFGHSSYGASTITQQLVRHITNDNEDTPSRKFREISRAYYLEQNYSKKEILEMYINIINYGYKIDGLYNASKTFFGVNPSKLNIAQSAVLAAIINAPDRYNPYTSSGKKNLLERKNLVLKEMYTQGYITKKEYKSAKSYKIVFKKKKNSYKDQYINLALDEATHLVATKYHISNDLALEKILNQKTKIYTNMDTKLQKECYNILKYCFPSSLKIETGFILTTKDGKILTAITSRTDSSIDHVKKMTRQPGSSIKPIGVYAPAFDLNIYSSVYDTVTDSAPNIPLEDNKYYNPSNSYGYYKGNVEIREAIASSINTIAVKTLYNLGLDNSFYYLKAMGITSLTKNDKVYPLALGGLSKGISPFEMTRAYNVINNDGVYTNISFIDKIVIDGDVIVPKKNENKVLVNGSANIKYCLNYAVTNGTAKNASIDNIITYAKTGTTSDKKDLWLCGFTDDVTASLWAGYDTPEELPYASSDIAAIWSNLLSNYYYK
jgi:penicillin-binding protein 1A